ncbi:MAG TPA: hypothetical protein VMT19_02325, partial [Thermoanaerobaculaceae bacterium]|nr:hypothetical protein [Thermoanaerobaculaceae bacterium]
MRRLAILLRRALAVVGVAFTGTWGAVTLLAHTANFRNAEALDRLIREGGGAAGAARSADLKVTEGALLGRIDVPRVGVSTVILEGTSERVLEQA